MIYLIGNGPGPTTAAQAVLTTGTAIKTHLQLKNTLQPFKIIEWGVSFDGYVAAAPGKIELLDTGTVFATVTAFAAGDFTKLSDPNGPDADTVGFNLGTGTSGYAASAEGTITAVEEYDFQLISPCNQYVKQFPLGREPLCKVNNSVRIRMTFAAAVNAYAYMIVEV